MRGRDTEEQSFLRGTLMKAFPSPDLRGVAANSFAIRAIRRERDQATFAPLIMKSTTFFISSGSETMSSSSLMVALLKRFAVKSI